MTRYCLDNNVFGLGKKQAFAYSWDPLDTTILDSEINENPFDASVKMSLVFDGNIAGPNNAGIVLGYMAPENLGVKEYFSLKDVGVRAIMDMEDTDVIFVLPSDVEHMFYTCQTIYALACGGETQIDIRETIEKLYGIYSLSESKTYSLFKNAMFDKFGEDRGNMLCDDVVEQYSSLVNLWDEYISLRVKGEGVSIIDILDDAVSDDSSWIVNGHVYRDVAFGFAWWRERRG
ncbi:MAG: hypothetical protein KAI53_03020 [Candidatus Aenigmarchaeota archaeon]|nr:hypothetical protein [Candidatus Aenigmarchaeota archaeon]